MVRTPAAVMRRPLTVTPFVETFTANYGWTKPEIGASSDVWGAMLNADLDSIDSIVHSISTVAASSFVMQQLTVTATNTFSALSQTPNMALFILFVNGQPFFPVGTTPDFTVVGVTISWLSTTFGVAPGSRAFAVYTWSS